MLDKFLLGQDREITKVASPHLFFISRAMLQSVSDNFNMLNDFESHLHSMNKEAVSRSLVIQTLLSHFNEVFKEVRLSCHWKSN